MPPWLLLLLAVAGLVLWTALLAAGSTGSWYTFKVAAKQFALVLLGLALPALLVGLWLFIWYP